MIGKILKSIALITVISVGLPWLTYDGVSLRSFGKWCVIYTLAQIFCNTIYVSCVDYILLKKLNEQTIERYNKQLQTIVPFDCPCPVKTQQPVSVNMAEQNSYKCTHCKKRINVNIHMDNALATTPVDATVADINKIVQGFNEELKLND